MPNGIKEKIARLEERMNSLNSDFQTFMTNDFCHLRSRVDAIITALIFGFISTIAIQIFLNLME